MNFLDYIESPMCISTGPVSISNGGAVIANGAAIQSKYRGPLLITEMQFTIQVATIAVGGRIPDPREPISVSIAAGRMSFTNDFIPIALLGPTNGIRPPVTIGDFQSGLQDLTTDQNAPATYATTYWRFPKMLFYPPSLGFNIRYARQATWLSALPIQIDCCVRGYYLRKDMPYPTEIDVPWATGTTFHKYGAATPGEILTPEETLFRNPFMVPLYLQRFTGRYFDTEPSGANTWNLHNGLGPEEGIGGPDDDELVGDLGSTRLKIQKQDGTIFVPNASPFWQVIDFRRQLWNTGGFLKPNEMIDVRALNFLEFDPDDPVDELTFHGEPQFGMIGHRKEVLT